MTEESPIAPTERRRLGRRSVVVLAVLLVLAAFLGWDVSRPPADQLAARGLLGALGVYRAHISPVLGSIGVRCRFQPSCSRYAAASIERYGAGHGLWLTLGRLARCGPWTPAGTFDPPPDEAPNEAR